MKLYLDDDSVAAVLVALLQRAGHDVQPTPASPVMMIRFT